LLIDPVIASGVFARFSMIDGSTRSITADEWAERLLAIELSDQVPDTIHELFEVARGAMLYGSLYYPLFTLGLEQAFRLAEAAARLKAKSLGIATAHKGKPRKYYDLLQDLAARGVMTTKEEVEWSFLRKFRNLTSHPEQQMILSPPYALNMLHRIADTINRLFQTPATT
jgi:hypothetical protein